jgi:phosphoribosylglycinamide formyltransferase-1
VPVLPDDDEGRLAARILAQEHVILPQAIRWFLDDQLTIEGDRVMLSADCRYPGAITSPLSR